MATHASLDPKTSYRFLQHDDARGTGCERVDPRPRRRMTYLRCVRLLPPSAFAEIDAKQRAATATRLRRSTTRADRTDPSEGSRDFRTRESPPRTEPHTSMSCACPRRRADPFPHFARAPSDSPRANARRAACRSPFAHRPAKGGAFIEDRGAFRPRAFVRVREDRSPRSVRTCLPSTRRPTPSGEDRRFATRRTCASLTAPRFSARRDVPSTRCGSIERSEMGVAYSPPRTGRSQRPRRLP